jgi:enoyl-CoA hydratase/carnithine racemase
MPMIEPAYFTAFKNFAFTRTPSGVLTLRFHTEGGPATFTGQMHTDFPRALYEIGEDRDNRVLVLTGTGDRFMTEIDGQSLDDPTQPAVWDKTIAEGRRIMQRLVDLEMPIVAAAAGAGTRRGSRRQAAVADQVPGGHRAPAPQPPDGRGISARLGAGRPHRR